MSCKNNHLGSGVFNMLFRYAMLLLSVILHNFFVLKGVIDCFFLGFIVFMGCSLTCVNASLKKALSFTYLTFILHRSVPSLIN